MPSWIIPFLLGGLFVYFALPRLLSLLPSGGA